MFLSELFASHCLVDFKRTSVYLKYHKIHSKTQMLFSNFENGIINIKSTFWIWIIQNDSNIWNQGKIPLFFIRLCESINLRDIERFYTEFWLSTIRPVAHSLSGRLIKDVLQFNGSLYSEKRYDCKGSWEIEDIWKF